MTRLHRTETRGPISKHIYRRNAERWIYQSIVLLRERDHATHRVDGIL